MKRTFVINPLSCSEDTGAQMCQDDEQLARTSDVEISALVGWVATSSDGIHDTDIVEYCSRLGARNYNFMNYPVGGMKRSSWHPEKLVHLLHVFLKFGRVIARRSNCRRIY